MPKSSRCRKTSTSYLIQALIGENGEVLDLVLLQSAVCSLAQAAIYAVNQTEFTPATLDHKTIATTMNIPILFR